MWIVGTEITSQNIKVHFSTSECLIFNFISTTESSILLAIYLYIYRYINDQRSHWRFGAHSSPITTTISLFT